MTVVMLANTEPPNHAKFEFIEQPFMSKMDSSSAYTAPPPCRALFHVIVQSVAVTMPPETYTAAPQEAEFESIVQFDTLTIERSWLEMAPPPAIKAVFEVSVLFVTITVEFSAWIAPPKLAEFDTSVQSAARTRERSQAWMPPPTVAWLVDIVTDTRTNSLSSLTKIAPPKHIGCAVLLKQ